MLTIFTCPKPFTNPHIRLIQRNAIQSWMQLEPRPEIILMGDDAGVPETAEELGLTYCHALRKNEYGTPLVSDIFRQAETIAKTKCLCYVNCDIIMGPDLTVATRVCSRQRKFLCGGLRWNLDLNQPIDFENGNWHKELLDEVNEKGEQFDKRGIDYFLFSGGLWKSIPDFALGRLAWDNWLLYGCLANGGMLIDASSVVRAVHQNHDYSHHVHGNDLQSVYDGPESKENYCLADGKLYDLDDSRYELTARGLQGFRDRPHVFRRVARMPTISPRIARLLPSWKLKLALSWMFPSI